MARWVGLLIFVGMLLATSLGLHGYVYHRLVHATQMAEPLRTVMKFIFGILVFVFFMPILLYRFPNVPIRDTLLYFGFVWMGTALLIFTSCLAVDVIKICIRGYQLFVDMPTYSPERRLLVGRTLSGIGAAAAVVGAGKAVRIAQEGPVVETVPITIDKLPKSFDGFRILQISDLHVGDMIQRRYVEDVVRRVNEQRPDLVAVTGDLVDGTPQELYKFCEPLKELSSPHGTYFVTGNHEYYSGVDPWLRTLEDFKWHVLRNENVKIDRDGDHFHLLGIDDHGAKRIMPDHGPDLKRAMQGVAKDATKVLLSHRPKGIDEAAVMGVDLQLSGHTHGGQIWPFDYLTMLAHPFLQGLGKRDQTQIYVNRGTGFWGPPMRLGGESEITVIELKAKA